MPFVVYCEICNAPVVDTGERPVLCEAHKHLKPYTPRQDVLMILC